MRGVDRSVVGGAARPPDAEVMATAQSADAVNGAASQVEPPSFLRGIFEQFAQPSGWLGGVAGLLMARTANDDRWLVDLLDIQPGDRVLNAAILADRAHSGFVVGVDPSDVMLRQAASRNVR